MQWHIVVCHYVKTNVMVSAYFKKGLIVSAIYIACTGALQAGTFTDNNKKGSNTTTTSTGLQVKQRKPNLYVRFFNKVYNKYAVKHVAKAPDKKKEKQAQQQNYVTINR